MVSGSIWGRGEGGAGGRGGGGSGREEGEELPGSIHIFVPISCGWFLLESGTGSLLDKRGFCYFVDG